MIALIAFISLIALIAFIAFIAFPPLTPDTAPAMNASHTVLPRLLAIAIAIATAIAAMLVAATALPAHAGSAGPAPLADWRFTEVSGTTLNLAANTGAGLGGAPGRWDVAIPGVATDGAGGLRIRNSGAGGSGTRTSYADFGPVPAVVTEGLVDLYASFSAWNLTGAPGSNGPRFTLALIEGNDFETASFSLSAGAAGLLLGAGSDPFGNGGAIAQTATLASAGTTPFTVRLSVDLQALSYSLALNTGSGFAVLGSAPVDSFTAGINSLRLSLTGDFTLGAQTDRGLTVDRVWAHATPVPEPGSALLLLLGVTALGLARRFRRARQPAAA